MQQKATQSSGITNIFNFPEWPKYLKDDEEIIAQNTYINYKLWRYKIISFLMAIFVFYYLQADDGREERKKNAYTILW